jgi:hypothetical protein
MKDKVEQFKKRHAEIHSMTVKQARKEWKEGRPVWNAEDKIPATIAEIVLLVVALLMLGYALMTQAMEVQ